MDEGNRDDFPSNRPQAISKRHTLIIIIKDCFLIKLSFDIVRLVETIKATE